MVTRFVDADISNFGGYRLEYRGLFRLDIAGSSSEDLAALAAYRGCQVRVADRLRPPLIEIGPILSEAQCCELSLLDPGETVVCRRDAATLIAYCRDGVASQNSNDRLSVRLCPRIHVSDSTAFGIAHDYLMAQQGALFLHAAAFVIGRDCFIALGDSCAGKSTLCAAALAIGGRVLSDDSIMVIPARTADESLAVHANRKDAFFFPDTAGLLPLVLRKHVERPEPYRRGKLVMARERVPSAFDCKALPTHLLLLSSRVAGDQHVFRAASQAEAFAAIVAGSPWLTCIGLRDSNGLAQTARQFVASVPASHLGVASTLLEDPARAARSLLDICGSSGAGRAEVVNDRRATESKT
jgi:hypothetical protein